MNFAGPPEGDPSGDRLKSPPQTPCLNFLTAEHSDSQTFTPRSATSVLCTGCSVASAQDAPTLPADRDGGVTRADRALVFGGGAAAGLVAAAIETATVQISRLTQSQPRRRKGPVPMRRRRPGVGASTHRVPARHGRPRDPASPPDLSGGLSSQEREFVRTVARIYVRDLLSGARLAPGTADE